MSHQERDEPFERGDSGRRPPRLNLTCPGHGDLTRGGTREDEGGGDGGGGEVTAMLSAMSRIYREHDRSNTGLASMSFDRPESVNGQEGVEEEMVEVGDFGFVPRSIINRAPSPDTACRCRCRCQGCFCHPSNYIRYRYFVSPSSVENADDSPPESLMVEQDGVQHSFHSIQRSFSSPNMSGVLHGITGAREAHVRGLHGPAGTVQCPPVLPEDEDVENDYPPELSESDFDV